jgi:PIN domain nuclease of toxin-antitoxin system
VTTRPRYVLLDTHIWLWASLGIHSKISTVTQKALEDAAVTGGLLVSIISVWEIALLVSRGKVALPAPLDEWTQIALSRPDLRLVGLTRPGVVIDSVNLPGEFHGDPADRFLVATARAHRAKLATYDRKIIEYARGGYVEVLGA